MRSAKLTFFEEVSKEAKDRKKIWKEIARVLGGVKNPIAEVTMGTETLTDCKGIVDAFSSQFVSLIRTVHNQPCTSGDLIPHVDSVFCSEDISEECVFAM